MEIKGKKMLEGTMEEIEAIKEEVIKIMKRRNFSQFLNTFSSIDRRTFPEILDYLRENVKGNYSEGSLKTYFRKFFDNRFEAIGVLREMKRTYIQMIRSYN